MENVSKVLLIAAGMFLAIILLSLLVYFYGEISDFYDAKHESTMIEQAQKFNKKFEAYDRNNIRGSDLISLMNMIIDYNATESYFDDKEYERIVVKIDLQGKEKEGQFIFKKKLTGYVSGDIIDSFDDLEDSIITNSEGIELDKDKTKAEKYNNDKNLVAITNTPNNLIQLAQNSEPKIEGMTDAKLQQLASRISTIFTSDTDMSSRGKSNRLERAKIIEDLLDIELELDDEKALPTSNSDSEKYIKNIQNITNQYYQYMQFKRAYFNCTEVEYDPKVSRIVKMNFVIKLDGSNNVVFN